MEKKKSTKRIVWIIISLAVVAAVAYFLISAKIARDEANAVYQTQVLEKGDLTAIVGATGTVRANQTVTVPWLTSGRIEELKVDVGDRVNTGDVLATLAQSSLSQSIILAQSDLVAAQRNLDDLINSSATSAQAQLNLANALQNYDKVRWSQLSSDEARGTNQDQIDSVRAAVTLAKDKVDKAEERYNDFSETADSDPLKASALKALATARQELAIAENNLKFYTIAPNDREVAISDGKVAVAKAQLEDAQREWERLKDGPDPADIAAAEARVAAIQATLDMAHINAPFSGTVTESMGMVGDLVTAGSKAFRIDDLSHMYVDVEIPEVDINNIIIGQDVTLSFDAIPATEYQGRVTEVARVGVSTAGSVNFKVTIEVLNTDEKVLPGMTAAVNIVVSDVKDVLIIPNRAVRALNGKRVIYIMKNNIPTPVEIEIGSSSDTYSEVVSGELKVGDTIILNPSMDLTSFMTGGPFGN